MALTVLAVAVLPVASLLSVPFAWDSSGPAQAMAVALALGCASVAATRTPGHRTRRAALVLAIAVALVVLSSAVSGPASGFFGVPGRLQGVLSLFVLAGAAAVGVLAVSRRMRVMVYALALTAIVEVGFMVVQSSRGQAPAGTFGNSVPAGAFLAVAGAVLIAFALAEKGRLRFLFSGLALVVALGVGLSGSRGALIALVAGGVVAVVGSRAKLQRTAVVVSVLVVAIVLGAVAGGGLSAKIGLGSLASGSAGSRWQIWRGTERMIADHPLLGVGAGRFLYEFPAYQPLQHALIEAVDTRADQAHSLPLQVAAESGLPAAIALLVVAGMAVAAGIFAVRRRDGAALLALAGFSAYCVQAFVGVPSMGVDVVGWALGGALLARADVAEEREAGTAPKGSSAVVRYGGVGLAMILAATVVWYVAGDMQYARGVASFDRADFAAAFSFERRAIALNPYIDIYRVGLADSAQYLGADAMDIALESLDRGLALEPDSHDLLLARARLLRVEKSPPGDVAAAYRDAVAAYPMGVTVNREALAAYQAAGSTSDVQRTEAALRALSNRAGASGTGRP